MTFKFLSNLWYTSILRQHTGILRPSFLKVFCVNSPPSTPPRCVNKQKKNPHIWGNFIKMPCSNHMSRSLLCKYLFRIVVCKYVILHQTNITVLVSEFKVWVTPKSFKELYFVSVLLEGLCPSHYFKCEKKT